MLIPILLDDNTYALVKKEELPKINYKNSYQKLGFQGDGFFIGKVNGTYYLIDKVHNVVELKGNYDEVKPFVDGLAPVHDNSGWNFINRKGKKICEYNYYDYTILSNRFILVQTSEMVWEEPLTGVIDFTGFEVIKPELHCFIDLVRDDFFFVSAGSNYLLYSIRGELLGLTSEFSFITKFECDRAIGIHKATAELFIIDLNFNKIKLLGKNKTEIIDFDIDGFNSGLMPFNIGGNWGLIDSSGNKITKFIYASVEKIIEGFSVVSIYIDKAFKYSFIDKEGNEIVEYIYSKIYSFSEGFATIQHEDKYGMIDTMGSLIIKAEFSSISKAKNGFVIVSIGEDRKMFGFYNTQGKKVSMIKYDFVQDFENGFAIVEINDRFGVIDQYGNAIIQIQYDQIMRDFENYFSVFLNGKNFIVDQFGFEYSKNFLKNPTLEYVSRSQEI